ncbi:hypothetical protein PF003_g38705 [Phytophthora fragariae]|nr:hypothetical protein PF003_g38705 [Phytophthora fragariae]
MMCCAQTSKRQSEASPPVKQPLITGTAGAATQPGTDSDVKEAAQTPSVHDDPPTGREVKRKLPDLPFQHKYGSGENYYVRECYEKYYPLVEQFVLTGDKLTVTGASEIGTSVFYAYCFEAFCKAHRDEWIVVAVSYDKNGEATEFAVYEDGVETTRVTYADEETILTVLRDLQRQLGKMAGYQDGKGEETKEKIKKILLLCDGVPKTRRPNMVVFTSPNEECRVEVFRGTARFCLSRDASEVTLAKERLVELIVREIRDGTGLQDLLFKKTTEDTRNSLLHLDPPPDQKRYATIKLASSFVRTKLEQCLQMLEFTAREHLRLLLGKRTRGAAEWIFEYNSHEILRQGCELRVTSLPDGDIAPVEESTLLITRSNSPDEFDADTLSPSLVTSGPYHKPTAKKWESIDSFYLPKMNSDKLVPDRTAAKWNKDTDGPLILFQMTISKSHRVNASGLVYVLSKLEFLERLEHVKLVFVVPKKLVGKVKRQPIDLVTAVGTDSVQAIKGIGQVTSDLLNKYGINTIADLEREVKLREKVKKQKPTTKKQKTKTKESTTNTDKPTTNTDKPTTNAEEQTTNMKAATLKDARPERWAHIVKLWKKHELTVKYGEKVAAIAQYVGSFTPGANGASARLLGAAGADMGLTNGMGMVAPPPPSPMAYPPPQPPQR